MQLRRLRLMIRVMLIPCMVAALVGCASHDTLYGRIYDGLRARDALIHPRMSPNAPPSPAYAQYTKMRGQHLGQDADAGGCRRDNSTDARE